jgi:hypothetical protein
MIGCDMNAGISNEAKPETHIKLHKPHKGVTLNNRGMVFFNRSSSEHDRYIFRIWQAVKAKISIKRT